mgnify:CR=1 FL=1
MAESAIEGKIALVTGAAKGLGRAISLKLADKGVRLALNYKSSGDEAQEVAWAIKKKGGEAIAIQADVSNASQVTAWVNQVEEEMGTVDILVNNAAILVPGSIETVQPRHLDLIWQIDLRGPLLLIRDCVPHMRAAGGGHKQPTDS